MEEKSLKIIFNCVFLNYFPELLTCDNDWEVLVDDSLICDRIVQCQDGSDEPPTCSMYIVLNRHIYNGDKGLYSQKRTNFSPGLNLD